MAARTVLTEQAKPRFAPHVRFRKDQVRDRWVVLAPERMFLPDETSVEILKLCDGERTIAAISHDLARLYQAPAAEICADMMSLLQDLADKGVLQA